MQQAAAGCRSVEHRGRRLLRLLRGAVRSAATQRDSAAQPSATDAQGASWSAPVYTGLSLWELHLFDVNGCPAFFMPWQDDLIFAFSHGADASGTAWLLPETLLQGFETREGNQDQCYATIAGQPAVLKGYHDYNQGRSIYQLWWRLPDGSGWSANEVPVATSEPVGYETNFMGYGSLLDVGGRPALFFMLRSGGGFWLAYLSALDPAGARWNPPELVASVSGEWVSSDIAAASCSGKAACVFVERQESGIQLIRFAQQR